MQADPSSLHGTVVLIGSVCGGIRLWHPGRGFGIKRLSGVASQDGRSDEI